MSTNSHLHELERIRSLSAWAVDHIEELRDKIKQLEGKVAQHCHTELKRALLIVANKKRRDRQSAPDTIRQDAEIHRLRNENKKHWTWKRLARRFGMKTESGARKAFNRHQNRLQDQYRPN
jgi:hypothetical protein